MTTKTKVPARREADRQLYADSAWGIYIPQYFAESVARECISGIDNDELDRLKLGPDTEDYWDIWADVLDLAVLTSPENGKSYTLHQDGDLWMIEQGAEYDDKTDEYYINL